MSARLEVLKMERNELVEELMHKKGDERAKILVRIMDLDEDINREMQLLSKKVSQTLDIDDI